MKVSLCDTGALLRRAMISAAESALASGDRISFDEGRRAFLEHLRSCEQCGIEPPAQYLRPEVQERE